MTSFSITILLVIASQTVLAKILNHHVFPDEGKKYSGNIGWLFEIEEEPCSESEETSVCETDECKNLANHISKYMNKSVDPCEDFYTYTCGGWNSEDLIPPDEKSWGNNELFQDMVHRRIRAILASDPQPTDILPVRQAKKWYRSCMDVEEREKRGIKPVESILLQGGGWPMTMEPEEWDESDYSWKKVESHYFYITGKFTLYTILPSWRRSNEKYRGEIALVHGIFPLKSFDNSARRNYTGEHYTAYVNLIKNIAEVFVDHSKADVSEEMIEKDVKDLVEFEKKLDKIIPEDDDKEETTVGDFIETYNAMVEDIDSKAKIPFRNRLKEFFNMDRAGVNDSTPIMVIAPDYYANLSLLLSETSPRTIVNYLHWNFVSNVLPYTSDEVKEFFFELAEIEDGVDEKKPLWKECTEQVDMGHATTYAYVTENFDKSTEKAAAEMLENIRREMASLIDQSNWLDDDGKQLAKDKLNSMKIFLGYPEWYRNRTAVVNAYKGLKIGYDYFENMLSYNKYEMKMMLKAMMGEDISGPWGELDATIVNAWYGPETNDINLPAANFQPPLFTHNMPENVNYGYSGNTIGHEIGHGFDDYGITYGKDGNDTELSDQMIESYYKQARCFLDQYNEYFGVTEPEYEETTPAYGEGSFGRRTRGENIADTTGLDAVFEAYRKVIAKKPNGDFKLPGFEEYTDEQMFFIAFGVSWCGTMRKEYAERVLAIDSHSPGRLRVIGSVSNTKDFAKVFSCPKGSAMNPDDKCNIWEDEEKQRKKSASSFRNHRKHSRWGIK